MTPVDLADIHARLLSIEEKMAAIAETTSQIRSDGFSRITRLETQMEQFMKNDIPHLQKDVESLKKTFSAKRVLLYSGGMASLVVALVNLARMLRLLP